MLSQKIHEPHPQSNPNINSSSKSEQPCNIEFVNDPFLKQFETTIQNYDIEFPTDKTVKPKLNMSTRGCFYKLKKTLQKIFKIKTVDENIDHIGH